MGDLDEEAHDDIVEALGEGEITEAERDQQFWEQWDAEIEADPLLAKIIWEEQGDG